MTTTPAWVIPVTALVFFVLSAILQSVVVNRRAVLVAERTERARASQVEVPALLKQALVEDLSLDAEKVQLASLLLSGLIPTFATLQPVASPTFFILWLTAYVVLIVLAVLALFLRLPPWLRSPRVFGQSFIGIGCFLLVLSAVILAFVPSSPAFEPAPTPTSSGAL